MSRVISLLTLDGLPKTTAAQWLVGGEAVLALASLMLLLGLIGLVRKSRWIPEPPRLAVRRAIFRMFVVAGIVGAVASDGIIFAASHRLQMIQQQELLTANHGMSPAESNTLALNLLRFSDEQAEIVEFPVTFEHDLIASEILGLLSTAQWKVRPIKRLASPPDGVLIQGALIRATGDARSQAAAKALFDGLRLTRASAAFMPQPLPDPQNPRVWVFVGEKPTSLRTWVTP